MVTAKGLVVVQPMHFMNIRILFMLLNLIQRCRDRAFDTLNRHGQIDISVKVVVIVFDRLFMIVLVVIDCHLYVSIAIGGSR